MMRAPRWVGAAFLPLALVSAAAGQDESARAPGLETLAEQAAALGEQARALLLQDRFQEAEPLLVEALHLLDGTPDPAGEAILLGRLATGYVNSGRLLEAQPLLERWIALLAEQPAAPPAQVVASHLQLSRIYVETGRFPQAEPLLERVIALGDAADSGGSFNRGTALESLFWVRVVGGRFDEAEELVEPFLEVVRATGDARLLDSKREFLALAFMTRNAFGPAVKIWRATVRDKEAEHGKNSAQLIPALLALGGAEADAGDLAAAEAVFERCRKLLVAKSPGELEALAEVYFSLGHLQLARGNRGKAEDLLAKSVDSFDLAGTDNRQLTAALMELGMLRMEQGKFAVACDVLRQGTDVTERRSGISPELIQGLMVLSSCEIQRGAWEEADEPTQRALHLADRIGGAPPRILVELLGARATVLRGLGRDDEAEKMEQRLRSLSADLGAGFD